MSLGHRHQSLRRRGFIAANVRSKFAFRTVDALAYAVSFLSLLFTLDQVRIIWVEHSAEGVSLISWAFYTLSAFVWLCYGLIHKDRVLTVTNFLWVAFSLFIVVGVALYN